MTTRTPVLRVAVMGAALSGLWLATRVAHADIRPTRSLEEAITIEGNGSCLDRPALASAVVRWLHVAAIDVRVSIVVTANETPTPNLSFVVQREGATVALREFSPPPATCDDVRSSLSIAIAMAIEATVLAPPRPPPPPEPPAPEPVRAAAAPPPRVAVDADAVLLVSVLPTVAMGARLGVELELAGRFSLGIASLATLTSRADVGPGAGETRLIAGELDACWITPRSAFRLRLCAGGAGGTVIARGDGFAPSLSAHLPWGAAVARAGLRARLWDPFDLQLGLAGFLPFVRPELQVRTGESSSDVVSSRSLPSVGGAAEIGLVVTF